MSDPTKLAMIILYRNGANEAKARVMSYDFISTEFDPHDLIVNSNIDLDQLTSRVTDLHPETFTITCHQRKENDQLILVLESGILKPIFGNTFTNNIELPITQVIPSSTQEETAAFRHYTAVLKGFEEDRLRWQHILRTEVWIPHNPFPVKSGRRSDDARVLDTIKIIEDYIG